MASVGIVKIINGETIHKQKALFRIKERFPLLRKEKDQLPYFLQANYDIAEATKKVWSQQSGYPRTGNDVLLHP